MGLDGGFLHCLLKEIGQAIGAKVDKVYQPARDELVFLLRSKEFNGRLFVSANPGCARLHFTNQSIENPAQPPMFCMLLRKHLTGSRLVSVSQHGLDRVALLDFEGISELGDTTHIRLAVELMGSQANIILVGTNGRIIDSVRRSDLEKGGRIIQPGATYTLPRQQDKLSLTEHPAEQLFLKVESLSTVPEKAYLSALEGVSPLVSRELAYMGSDIGANIKYLVLALKNGGSPCAVADTDGKIIDFSYIPIKQYGNSASITEYESYSAMLDTIYGQRDRKNRISQSAKEITRVLSSAHGRILRKLEHRRNELEKCKEREKYRVWGELLKANLHLVKPGSSSVRVKNYYDPRLSEINIPLNNTLSGSANAASYFKEYKKLCNAERMLGELIAEGESELKYIESVTDALERAESISDITEIIRELEESGYIHRRVKNNKKPQLNTPKEYISPDGFKVLAGKNNIQNDLLTFKTASKEDIWLHVKDFPGAHVIIVANGKKIPHSTILFAANAAAVNTAKVSRSASVPVDYTSVKRVKKVPGGKPGMVTYTDQHTIYVTPDAKLLSVKES